MRVLIDTQCWLWMHADPDRLSATARRIVASGATRLVMSAGSIWEMAIKSTLGKLRLPLPLDAYVLSRLEQSRTAVLPIDQHHALRAAALPPHHRDPFDRMLIAQAQVERLPILTADVQLKAYDVEILGL